MARSSLWRCLRDPTIYVEKIACSPRVFNPPIDLSVIYVSLTWWAHYERSTLNTIALTTNVIQRWPCRRAQNRDRAVRDICTHGRCDELSRDYEGPSTVWIETRPMRINTIETALIRGGPTLLVANFANWWSGRPNRTTRRRTPRTDSTWPLLQISRRGPCEVEMQASLVRAWLC